MKKQMNKYVGLIYCLLISNLMIAQNNAIFGGGNSGGSAFSCATGNNSLSPLPIELLSFTANCSDNTVVLNWSTASEINNDFFTAEWSENAENWEIVGVLNGAGNSTNKLEYTLTDPLPYRSTRYYRLKQTDYNGEHIYSKIITVHNCIVQASKKISLYPNPSTGMVYIDPNYMEKDQLFLIGIYDKLGQQVYFTMGHPEVLDLAELSGGIYTVIISLPGNSYAEKIVIMK